MTETRSTLTPQLQASPDAAAAAVLTIDGVFRRAFDLFAGRIAVTGEDGAVTCGELGDRVPPRRRRRQSLRPP